MEQYDHRIDAYIGKKPAFAQPILNHLAYRHADEVLFLACHGFEKLLKSGSINTDAIVYNNLVQNLTQLEDKWEVPFIDSWHIQLFRYLVVN